MHPLNPFYGVPPVVVTMFSHFFERHASASGLKLDCTTRILRDIVHNAIRRLCPQEKWTTGIQEKGVNVFQIRETSLQINGGALQNLALRLNKLFNEECSSEPLSIDFCFYVPVLEIPDEWFKPDIPFDLSEVEPNQNELARTQSHNCVMHAFLNLFNMGVGQKGNGIAVTEVRLICETRLMCWWIALTLNNLFKTETYTKQGEPFSIVVKVDILKLIASRINQEYCVDQHPPAPYCVSFRTLAKGTIPQYWFTNNLKQGVWR